MEVCEQRLQCRRCHLCSRMVLGAARPHDASFVDNVLDFLSWHILRPVPSRMSNNSGYGLGGWRVSKFQRQFNADDGILSTPGRHVKLRHLKPNYRSPFREFSARSRIAPRVPTCYRALPSQLWRAVPPGCASLRRGLVGRVPRADAALYSLSETCPRAPFTQDIVCGAGVRSLRTVLGGPSWTNDSPPAVRFGPTHLPEPQSGSPRWRAAPAGLRATQDVRYSRPHAYGMSVICGAPGPPLQCPLARGRGRTGPGRAYAGANRIARYSRCALWEPRLGGS